MSGFSSVILVGNLTADPELRYTNSGTGICNLRLAVSRKYRSQNELKEETAFIDVEVWGKQIDPVSKYCSKGSQVLVDGRIKQERWNDRNSGAQRTRLVVVANTVQFLGAPKQRQQQAPQQAPPPQVQPQQGEPQTVQTYPHPAPQQTQTSGTGQPQQVYTGSNPPDMTGIDELPY